jgi:hypothetical protein
MLLDLFGLWNLGIPVGGGSGSRAKRRQSPLVVVEHEGKEYRVQAANLGEFLSSIKAQISSGKTRRRVVRLDTSKKPEVVLVSAPPEVLDSVINQVERINVDLSEIWAKIVQRYWQDIDDEEALLVLI